MTILTDIFSTRELALLSWILLFLLAITFNNGSRIAAFKVIKIFFTKRIIYPFLILLIYTSIGVLILYLYQLWELNLLKDTIFWFISFAFILFVNSHKINDAGYFKNILKDSFKLFLILEFIINFYTFGFWTEFLLLTLLLLLGIIQGTDQAKEMTQVDNLISYAFGVFGLILIPIVFYKTIIYYNELLTWNTLKTILLGPILTLYLIPFFYFLALCIKYDSLFSRINIFNRESKRIRLQLKFRVFKKVIFNLNSIARLEDKLKGRKITIEELDALKR